MKIKSSNVRKKNNELLNVTKVQSHVMLILHNVNMKQSIVRKKKKKEPPNVTKVLSNVTIEPSNMRKKKKETTKCDKKTVTYDIGTAQFENETIKCDKRTVTYDVGTT